MSTVREICSSEYTKESQVSSGHLNKFVVAMTNKDIRTSRLQERNPKNREWEKRRREKLNEAFTCLAKLLPNYDPASNPAKLDILERSSEFIKELRLSNSRLVSKQSSTDEKCKLIKELQDEVNKLILRVKQLVTLLKDSKIPIPIGPSIKKLGHECLQSNEVSKENNKDTGSQKLPSTQNVLINSQSPSTEETSNSIQNNLKSGDSTAKPHKSLEKEIPVSSTIFSTPVTSTITTDPNNTLSMPTPTILPMQTIILTSCPVPSLVPTQTTPILTGITMNSSKIIPKPVTPITSQLPKIPIMAILKPKPRKIKRRNRKPKKILNLKSSEATQTEETVEINKASEPKTQCVVDTPETAATNVNQTPAEFDPVHQQKDDEISVQQIDLTIASEVEITTEENVDNDEIPFGQGDDAETDVNKEASTVLPETTMTKSVSPEEKRACDLDEDKSSTAAVNNNTLNDSLRKPANKNDQTEIKEPQMESKKPEDSANEQQLSSGTHDDKPSKPEVVIEGSSVTFESSMDLVQIPTPCGDTNSSLGDAVSGDKISECIARSIDLIDAPDGELMELDNWPDSAQSPKSPISPTQMFLNMFPLLPRESNQPDAHSIGVVGISSKSSLQFPVQRSFFIDSMLPEDSSDVAISDVDKSIRKTGNYVSQEMTSKSSILSEKNQKPAAAGSSTSTPHQKSPSQYNKSSRTDKAKETPSLSSTFKDLQFLHETIDFMNFQHVIPPISDTDIYRTRTEPDLQFPLNPFPAPFSTDPISICTSVTPGINNTNQQAASSSRASISKTVNPNLSGQKSSKNSNQSVEKPGPSPKSSHHGKTRENKDPPTTQYQNHNQQTVFSYNYQAISSESIPTLSNTIAVQPVGNSPIIGDSTSRHQLFRPQELFQNVSLEIPPKKRGKTQDSNLPVLDTLNSANKNFSSLSLPPSSQNTKESFGDSNLNHTNEQLRQGTNVFNRFNNVSNNNVQGNMNPSSNSEGRSNNIDKRKDKTGQQSKQGQSKKSGSRNSEKAQESTRNSKYKSPKEPKENDKSAESQKSNKRLNEDSQKLHSQKHNSFVESTDQRSHNQHQAHLMGTSIAYSDVFSNPVAHNFDNTNFFNDFCMPMSDFGHHCDPFNSEVNNFHQVPPTVPHSQCFQTLGTHQNGQGTSRSARQENHGHGQNPNPQSTQCKNSRPMPFYLQDVNSEYPNCPQNYPAVQTQGPNQHHVFSSHNVANNVNSSKSSRTNFEPATQNNQLQNLNSYSSIQQPHQSQNQGTNSAQDTASSGRIVGNQHLCTKSAHEHQNYSHNSHSYVHNSNSTGNQAATKNKSSHPPNSNRGPISFSGPMPSSSAAARHVNWMTDSNFQSANKSANNNGPAIATPSHNPFSVSKLMGNNNTNNHSAHVSGPARSSSSSNKKYCAESLIKKTTNDYSSSSAIWPNLSLGQSSENASTAYQFSNAQQCDPQYLSVNEEVQFVGYHNQSQNISGSSHQVQGQPTTPSFNNFSLGHSSVHSFSPFDHGHPQQQFQSQHHPHPNFLLANHPNSSSSVSNFNLSTIFPEINDKRQSSSGTNNGGPTLRNNTGRNGGGAANNTSNGNCGYFPHSDQRTNNK